MMGKTGAGYSHYDGRSSDIEYLGLAEQVLTNQNWRKHNVFEDNISNCSFNSCDISNATKQGRGRYNHVDYVVRSNSSAGFISWRWENSNNVA